TSCLGTLSPNHSNAVLEIGRALAITAKPGAGYLFSNWVDNAGNVLTNGPTLKFVMQSNLVFQANFIPNPFIPVAGNYAGLFYVADTNIGVTVSNAGFFTATVTKPSGTFSAKLQLGPASYPIAGHFSLSGAWSTNSLKSHPALGA